MTPKRALNWFLNGFAITFAIPSVLIIISWNAIPGDKLYGVKTGLEDIALKITIKTPLASFLSVKYTERRFSEANTLLSKKGSALGYSLLVNEAKESTELLKEKKDKAQAQQLVNKIRDYKKQINQKKAALETGQITVPVANVTETAPPSTGGVPTTQPPPDVSNPQPETNVVQVIIILDQTNDELNEIEDDLKTNLGASLLQTVPSGIPTPLIIRSSLPRTSPTVQSSATPIVTPSPTINTETPSATPTQSPTQTPSPTP